MTITSFRQKLIDEVCNEYQLLTLTIFMVIVYFLWKEVYIKHDCNWKKDFGYSVNFFNLIKHFILKK